MNAQLRSKVAAAIKAVGLYHRPFECDAGAAIDALEIWKSQGEGWRGFQIDFAHSYQVTLYREAILYTAGFGESDTLAEAVCLAIVDAAEREAKP